MTWSIAPTRKTGIMVQTTSVLLCAMRLYAIV